jgi:hypothetical protein
MLEVIDCTKIDRMADSLSLAKRSFDVCTADDELPRMVQDLDRAARGIIEGGVLVNAVFAAGLNSPEDVQPKKLFHQEEASFLGRFFGVRPVDFTAALRRHCGYRALEKVVPESLIFKVDEGLSCSDGVGRANLMPYVAILPGSVYEIRSIG